MRSVGLALLLLSALACQGDPELRTVRQAATTQVIDEQGAWLATFTDGARTVRLRGQRRTFAESTTSATVTTDSWVRLLDAPFDGSVDMDWLYAALDDASPDVLAVAFEHVTGGARDASYGPLVDGVRQEGADFNDYLGITWRYPTGTVVDPDPAAAGSLDCSGFVRMVYGYRAGVPLVLSPRGDALPRRSFEIEASAPGLIVIPDEHVQVTDFSRLAAGDLVFHDADPGDGLRIDHTGIYLGLDSAGHHRFLSSRKSADGPTMGDVKGASILDGTGLYAASFRSARRL